MLHLWNTLHRKFEVFTPLKEGEVGLYTCGPTVYYYATIGNFRSYIFEDVLVRTLQMFSYDVKRVINITDVGHLVGDGDEGEDKVEREAKRVGKTAWDIAKFYEEAFFADFKKLNLVPPEIICRATEHIPEQIALVQRLEEKGFIYRATDGMYFDTSRFPTYGSFGGQKLSEKEAGARVEQSEGKRHPSDFALWKFSPVDEKRHMEWESPWGVGFPGWHIECSAMAKKYLGQPFDIHCGGIDHIPVHHENEIAQSEAAYGVPLAKYWLHNEFITVDGQRMGKSLGNGYTVSQLIEKGFDPIAYRYFCLTGHYRSKLNFTWEALAGNQTALLKIQRWVREYKATQSELGQVTGLATPHEPTMLQFYRALEDDLNTPKCCALFYSLLSSKTLTPDQIYATMCKMDRVLGFGVADWQVLEETVPPEIQSLFDARQNARVTKQWAESDRLRDELKAQGWMVEDKAGESSLRKL